MYECYPTRELRVFPAANIITRACLALCFLDSISQYHPFLACSRVCRGTFRCKSLKFLCPTKLHLCPQTCTLCPLFQSLPRPPHSLPRPPNSLPSPLRSQGLGQLRGSRAVETRRFRWKEIDVFFTIAVSLLPRRTQPMADNYRGRQSRTGGGTIYFMRPFQVPDTGTARGQHGPAAVQSRVRFPATD